LHKFITSADVIFFESTSYFDKETSKSIASESENDFMFFLENSSVSFHMSMWILCLRNMDRCMLDVPNSLPMSQLSLYLQSLNDIRCECFIPSPFVDIDSQSDLDIPITRHKRKKSCTLYPLHNFLSYAHLFTQYRAFISSVDSHPIPGLFQMSCHVQVGG